MNCSKCSKKIPRVGYLWLGKYYCYRCFELERDRLMDSDIDWNYEAVDVKFVKPKVTLDSFASREVPE